MSNKYSLEILNDALDEAKTEKSCWVAVFNERQNLLDLNRIKELEEMIEDITFAVKFLK